MYKSKKKQGKKNLPASRRIHHRRPYPDFYCMSFQRCGTTTFYEIIKQHPDVVLCRDVKEPMYYRIPFIWIPGLGRHFYEWRYWGHVKKGDHRIKGEINAGLTYSGCARRLAVNGNRKAKMIFMMRNPAERAYSAYKYFMARGYLPAWAVSDDLRLGHAKGFDSYVHKILDDPKQEPQVIKKRFKYQALSQSYYGTLIREYLKYFDIKNMKFVIFEEFIQNPEESCREIFDFLGLKYSDTIDYHIQTNESNERANAPLQIRFFLFMRFWKYLFYEFLCLQSWAPKLYDRFYRYYKGLRRDSISPDNDQDKILPETRSFLLKYWKKEIRETEKITGRKDLRELWK